MTSNRKPLFMLGLPTNGEHSYLFTQFLMATGWPTNFSMEFRAVQGMEVGEARNVLVQEAINLGAKYLMFIDEDVIGPQNGVRKLMYLLENHPEWTMVGGVYPTKTMPPEPLIFTEWAMGPSWDWKIGELIKVKSAGCGFNLFRVADMAAMTQIKSYETRDPWRAVPLVVREWFKTGDRTIEGALGVTREVHTEDSWFYSQGEKLGYEYWIDTSVWCRHYDKTTGYAFEVPTESQVAKKPDCWSHTPLTVNLGAGGDVNPYEVNVDLRAGRGINFKADIRQLPDDWAGKFDKAHADHVLEHFSWVDSEKIVREWARILRPGGTLTINVPDLQVAAENIVAGCVDNQVMGMIYGDQGHSMWNQGAYGGYDPTPKAGDEYAPARFLPHSFEHNAHKTGFTAATLGGLLQEAGLVDVSGERSGYNLMVQGTRPAQVDETLPSLPPEPPLEIAPPAQPVADIAPEAAQDGAASPAAEVVADAEIVPESNPA